MVETTILAIIGLVLTGYIITLNARLKAVQKSVNFILFAQAIEGERARIAQDAAEAKMETAH